jgi:hypothetical protein
MARKVRRGIALLAVAATVGSGLGIVAVTPATAGVDASARYEAEDATISQGAVNSDHTGFTGTGFVNFDNAVGSSVTFTITASAAQTTTLNFRFANGTTADRPMDIAVNGTVTAAARSFPPTADWDTWADSTLTVPLKAGANAIRLTGVAPEGGPNLDRITLS